MPLKDELEKMRAYDTARASARDAIRNLQRRRRPQGQSIKLAAVYAEWQSSLQGNPVQDGYVDYYAGLSRSGQESLPRSVEGLLERWLTEDATVILSGDWQHDESMVELLDVLDRLNWEGVLLDLGWLQEPRSAWEQLIPNPNNEPWQDLPVHESDLEIEMREALQNLFWLVLPPEDDEGSRPAAMLLYGKMLERRLGD